MSGIRRDYHQHYGYTLSIHSDSTVDPVDTCRTIPIANIITPSNHLGSSNFKVWSGSFSPTFVHHRQVQIVNDLFLQAMAARPVGSKVAGAETSW